MTSLAEVRNLTFDYDTRNALKDVSFTLEAGATTALVGPNGAGKTTLMRCLSAIAFPITGSVFVDGIDALADPRAVHARLGYLSDSFGLYGDLSVRSNISYLAGCHGLKGDALRDRVDWSLDLLGLRKVEREKCSSLSRGWRQRTGIAMTIVHKPMLLVLDEPASGLDPEARADLSLVFRSLKAQGMTLLVSSHILAELEEYCDSMLVLRDGRIVDSVAHTRPGAADPVAVRLRFSRPVTQKEMDAIQMVSAASLLPVENDGSLRMILPDRNAADGDILVRLVQAGVPLSAYHIEEESLQSVYLKRAGLQGDGK